METFEQADPFWKETLKQLRPAAVLLGLLTLLLGVIYPFICTLILQLTFPYKARGSLLLNANKQVIGSEILGQSFTQPHYFWSRPSAIDLNKKVLVSQGSNYANGHPNLLKAIQERAQNLQKYDHGSLPIPVDLVTHSASGFDPLISIAAAHYQIPRIAQARQIQPEVLIKLVQKHTQKRQLAIFGEPGVAVLPLNQELDQLTRSPNNA